MQKLRQLADGGITSAFFEFAGGAIVCRSSQGSGVMEHWLLANSTHVIDLAFHFIGLLPRLSGRLGIVEVLIGTLQQLASTALV